MVDGYKEDLLSQRGIQIESLHVRESRQRMNALWANYQQQLKDIEEGLPIILSNGVIIDAYKPHNNIEMKDTRKQQVSNLFNWNNLLGVFVWFFIIFTICFFVCRELDIHRAYSLVPPTIFYIWRLVVVFKK